MTKQLFDKVQTICQIDRDIVARYTKSAQKLVQPRIIPQAIAYLCLCFYHEYDLFDKAGDAVQIDDGNKDTVTTIFHARGGRQATATGLIKVNTRNPLKLYTYSWSFKLIEKRPFKYIRSISFGIESESGKRGHLTRYQMKKRRYCYNEICNEKAEFIILC